VLKKIFRLLALLTIIAASGATGYFAEPKIRPFIYDQLNIEDVASITTTTPFPQYSAYRILKCAVKVITAKGHGSGIVVFSEQDAKTGLYHSFVVTNHHVVADGDFLLIQQHNRINNREVESVTTYSGALVCASMAADVAVIEFITTEKLISATAAVANEYQTLKPFSDIFVCGAPLRFNPFVAQGKVADIDNESILANVFAIFGSSGGGVYDHEGRWVGLIRGVNVYTDPQGATHAMPTLVDIIPINKIAEYLSSQNLYFLIDQSIDGYKKYLATAAKEKEYR